MLYEYLTFILSTLYWTQIIFSTFLPISRPKFIKDSLSSESDDKENFDDIFWYDVIRVSNF